MPHADATSKSNATLTQAQRIVSAALNGALWAMAVALLFSKWTWLEMRFNVGWILLGAWAVIFAVILWRIEKPLGFAFSAANVLTCAIVYFALSGGIAGIQMIPAGLLREGLHQSGWNIGATNAGMLAFVAICLIAIAALERAIGASATGEKGVNG